MSTTVFITGATGYIAQHIVKQLLAKGYKVIGSVRSQEKGEDLQKLVESDDFQYVVVPNMTEPGAFDSVLKDYPEITVFIHTASPVTFISDDIKRDILHPAVDGTINVLAALKKYGDNIQRFVYTSSSVAVYPQGFGDTERRILTEKDFNPITIDQVHDAEGAYAAGKTFAEKAVWEFVEQESPKFKVSTVNPSYNFGPQAFEVKDKSQLNFSAEVINSVLKTKSNEELPPLAGDFIDVRDVARAHLAAFEKDEAIGQRLVLASEHFTNELIAHLIKQEFPDIDIPEGNVVKSEEQLQGLLWQLDTTKTEKILGFDYIPLDDSVVDTVEQILSVE